MKKTTKELLFLCFPLTKRLENASKVFFFVGKKKIVLGVFFVFFELRQFSCKQRCRRCGMQKLFEIRKKKKNCYFEKTFVVDQNKKNCCLKKPLLSIKKFVV